MSQDAGVAKVVDDVIVNMANMANSMTISQVPVAQLAGAATMGVQATGSSYRETREQGYSDTQSLVYGVVKRRFRKHYAIPAWWYRRARKRRIINLIMSKVPALKPIAGKIDDIFEIRY